MEEAVDPVVSLSALAHERLLKKAEENVAVAARRAIDANIVAIFKGLNKLKDEGSSSVKAEGDFKIEVTQPVVRSVPEEVHDDLRKVWNQLTPLQQGCFRWKPEVNVTNMKALQQTDPAAFGLIHRFIQSKPQSPQVVVENLQLPSKS